jgi:uncharacterized membrane protein YfcA
MKLFFASAVMTILLAAFSAANVYAHAATGTSSTVTIDLSMVIALISIIGAVVGALVGFLKIASVFESIRIRLSVIETKISDIEKRSMEEDE